MDIRKNKINLLHLITGLNSGGAERVVLDLTINSNKDLFNVYVGSISDGTHMLPVYHQNGIYPTIAYAKKTPNSIFKTILLFNKLVKDNDIQLIHAHMVHAMFISFFLKILNWNLRVVFTSHNINVESKLREFLLWMIKPFREIDIVFSKEMDKFFFKKNRVIIPNGIKAKDYSIDMKKFDIFTFLSIGRLEPQKNQQFLIDAANQLKGKFPFQILIVGKGFLEDEMVEKIMKNGVKQEVKLLGFRNDIIELCNQSHVFVMPSLWEGFPISLIEAGAAGLPVISTKVGGISKLVNSENGFLAGLEEFAETMEMVYSNYEEARIKGNNLRKEIIASYDISVIIDLHEKEYLKCFKN